MRLSSKSSSISGSLTLAIDAKAKKMKADGMDVVGFGAGEPDFDTPSFIKEAAKEALDRGMTRYTPVAGIVELKEAICR
ncbi:MAG: aspartate aminotransferase, partial [Clostridia bacterium]